jgi:diacylglycerol kinase family enzyme
MERFNHAWLLANPASGSNTPEAMEDVAQCLGENGITVDRIIAFPDDALPSADDLDAAGVELLIVYTGDGTLNSALTRLRGWSGAVLVLPGGTKNLLSKRLHGDYSAAEIVAVVGAGGAARRRIKLIAGECGDAYAGLLAGPGTHWGAVREAMREGDIAAIASGTAEAVAKSTSETMVRAVAPPLGSREGYPLIDLTPGEHGIQINGYNATTPGELAQQGWALLRREFREGPHDRLGIVDEICLESIDGSPVEVLLDGESSDAGPRVTFRVALSEVDLLATHHG